MTRFDVYLCLSKNIFLFKRPFSVGGRLSELFIKLFLRFRVHLRWQLVRCSDVDDLRRMI